MTLLYFKDAKFCVKDREETSRILYFPEFNLEIAFRDDWGNSFVSSVVADEVVEEVIDLINESGWQLVWGQIPGWGFCNECGFAHPLKWGEKDKK